ncbi:winged helix-turn-helix domain-containing protein [Deinococcus sp.]|uniref:winged helix-turn-helix domain-containing protein n=1 Tax=Deinococcus sp. TaxID=47478 RepID=UPI003C7EC046
MPETDLTLLRTLLISRDVLPCERKRYLALWHVQLGATTREIEQWKVMSADRVSRTVRLYREGGLDALLERVHPGGRSRISPQIASAIQAEIKKDQQVWDSASLMAYVQEAHGITIRRTALRVQLKHMGLSWQRTRYVVAGQADPQEKADFEDTLDVLKKGL